MWRLAGDVLRFKVAKMCQPYGEPPIGMEVGFSGRRQVSPAKTFRLRNPYLINAPALHSAEHVGASLGAAAI